MKKTLYAFGFCLFVFASCQKQEQVFSVAPALDSTSITGARESDPEEAKYDAMIETIANGLRDIRNDEQFRSIVHAQVSLQFDGDDNVLLKTLDSACTANSINLAAAMETTLNNSGRADLVPLIDQAIHGFPYFDDSIYLQIFVPNIAQMNNSTVPMILENHTTEIGGVYQGFDANNGLIQVSSANPPMILIWVVSGNEVVDNSGRPGAKVVLGTSGSGPTPKHEYIITEIDVTDKKEDFVNGRCELMYVQYRNGFSCAMITPQNMVYVDKFNVAVYPLTNNPIVFAGSANQWTNSPFISTLWYERDVRKKFERQEQVVVGCSNMGVTYRSAEDKYGIQTDQNPWAVTPNYTWVGYDGTGLTGLSLKKYFY